LINDQAASLLEMAKLAPSEIDRRLTRLRGWTRDGSFITKAYDFRTFMEGIEFVNVLASIAERMQHHPDVHIRWTKVRLEIQTHDEGGVTALDIRLAREIDQHIPRGRSQGRGPNRSP